jgi:hypothetical protein
MASLDGNRANHDWPGPILPSVSKRVDRCISARQREAIICFSQEPALQATAHTLGHSMGPAFSPVDAN